MARFILQPCKVRENRLVPKKNSELLELDWRELVVKLAPSFSFKALKTLEHLQRGSYIGLLKHNVTGKPVNFCFMATDRSGNISTIVRRDRTFKDRLLEVYLVVEAERGASVVELKNEKERVR